jgi:hypothetical protein
MSAAVSGITMLRKTRTRSSTDITTTTVTNSGIFKPTTLAKPVDVAVLPPM